MAGWYDGTRPITIAILAMGGEGGGVLADWIVDLGERNGHVCQNTSVAGVAQRTGATVYYIEMLPARAGDPGVGEPVLSVFPAPGEVDIVIASELMEAGRAVMRGFATPDRTVLIASTNRVYAMTEKIAPGDGRVDGDDLLAAIHTGSKRLIAADFAALAASAGSVISASLFGALARSGALPFGRDEFEAAIAASGKGVDRSLAAFAAGFDAAGEPPPRPAAPPASAAAGAVPVTLGRKPPRSPAEIAAVEAEAARNEIAASTPERLVGPRLAAQARRVGAEVPAAARSMALRGCERTAVYQDSAYTDLYLDRVTRLAAHDPDPGGDARLATEAARHLALWMCYQDTIHVAHQKLRRGRIERIRAEVGADPDQLVEVHEYLHPHVEEVVDTLPDKVGARLGRSKLFAKVVGRVARDGIVVDTTSVRGYAMLWTTARLRPTRPRSHRFVREQQAIDAWLDRAVAIAEAGSPDLAIEIVACQRVLKGYGATHAHGRDSFGRLMDAADRLAGRPGAAEGLAALRTAALADDDGTALDVALAQLPR